MKDVHIPLCKRLYGMPIDRLLILLQNSGSDKISRPLQLPTNW